MLDRLADELFAEHRPEAVLHTELAHELVSENGRTASGCGCRSPSAGTSA